MKTRDYGKKMHAAGMANGGEVDDFPEMKSQQDGDILGGFKSLFRRISEGNKDDSNSEAYYKYGAGKDMAQDDPSPAPVAEAAVAKDEPEDPSPKPVAAPAAAAPKPAPKPKAKPRPVKVTKMEPAKASFSDARYDRDNAPAKASFSDARYERDNPAPKATAPRASFSDAKYEAERMATPQGRASTAAANAQANKMKLSTKGFGGPAFALEGKYGGTDIGNRAKKMADGGSTTEAQGAPEAAKPGDANRELVAIGGGESPKGLLSGLATGVMQGETLNKAAGRPLLGDKLRKMKDGGMVGGGKHYGKKGC